MFAVFTSMLGSSKPWTPPRFASCAVYRGSEIGGNGSAANVRSGNTKATVVFFGGVVLPSFAS